MLCASQDLTCNARKLLATPRQPVSHSPIGKLAPPPAPAHTQRAILSTNKPTTPGLPPPPRASATTPPPTQDADHGAIAGRARAGRPRTGRPGAAGHRRRSRRGCRGLRAAGLRVCRGRRRLVHQHRGLLLGRALRAHLLHACDSPGRRSRRLHVPCRLRWSPPDAGRKHDQQHCH